MDILEKLSSNDPSFTHLDLRKMDVNTKLLRAIAEQLDKNTFVNRVSWKRGSYYNIDTKKKIDNRAEQNFKNFQLHPTDMIHALLSEHVYSESEEGNGVQFSKKGHVEYAKAWNEQLKNWRICKVFNHLEYGGYYSVAYLNECRKQIVLAHRGTEFKFKDLFKFDSPLKTDLAGILDDKIVSQQKMAFIVTEKMIAHAKEKGCNVSFTGHSLGAWLAELSLYFAVNNFGYSQSKAVTFDSPGSVSTLKTFESNVKCWETSTDFKNLDLITYLSAPNFVNCCDSHIGKVYRIFPKIDSADTTDALGKRVKKTPIAKHIEPILMGLLSLAGHKMTQIVATFDVETGKPVKLEKVIDWPRIKYQRGKCNTTLGKIINESIKSLPFLKFLPGFGMWAYELLPKPTFWTLIEKIDEFLNGNIDTQEFWRVYEHLEFNAKDGYPLKETVLLSVEEQFELLYEGHYCTQELNPFKDVYNSRNSDYYLHQLWKLSLKKIGKKEIDDVIKQELKSLKGKYKIEKEGDKKYICVMSSDIQVDILREEIVKVCKRYEEIKDILEDRNAYAPLNEESNQSPTITSYLPHCSENIVERPKLFNLIRKFLNRIRRSLINKNTIANENSKVMLNRRSIFKKILQVLPTLNESPMMSSALPPRSENILERPKVLNQIGKLLNQHRCLVICAFAGTGKSTIAKEYGHSVKENISGQIVHIISANSNMTITNAYKSMAINDLRLEIDGQESKEIMRSVHSIIRNSEASTLFILDDVKNSKDVRDYIEDLCSIESCMVIITTRNKNLSNDLNLQMYELDPFTSTEAISYLRKKLPENIFNPEDINYLITNLSLKDSLFLNHGEKNQSFVDLGDENYVLPYSLSHAVEYFNQNQFCTVKNYIEDLKKGEDPTSTFLLFDLLEESILSFHVLQYATYLDPNFNSTNFLQELLDINENTLIDAIHKLERLSLVHLKAKEPSSYSLQVHKLIQPLINNYTIANKNSKFILNRRSIFKRLSQVLPLLKESPLMRGALPPRSENIIERPNVLYQIGKLLNQHRCLVICAFAGTGKSTIAKEYGRFVKENISVRIVQIISANSIIMITDAYKSMAINDLRLEIDGQESKEIMRSVHSIIRNSEASTLFILDDVKNSKDVRDYVEDLCSIESCMVIITTRNKNLSNDLNLQMYELDPFTSTEAISYLRKKLPENIFNPEDINYLITNLSLEDSLFLNHGEKNQSFVDLGDKNYVLPYSLSNAVEYFNQNQFCTVKDYIEDLKKGEDPTSTFLLFDLLEESILSLHVLQYATYLDPHFNRKNIYQELLDIDEGTLNDVISKLEGLSLINLRALEYGQYGLQVHKFIQPLVKNFSVANKHLKVVLDKHYIHKRIFQVLWKVL